MEVRDMRYFLAVAEAGGFRRAAIRLNIGQSVLSRRMRDLEDRIGVSLFERHASGARMTSAGSSLLNRIRLILADLDAAVQAAGRHGIAQEGFLRLGFSNSLSRGPLRELVDTFVSDHPAVEMQIVESDRSEVLTLLSHRRLDLAVVPGEPPQAAGEYVTIYREEACIALPACHPLAHEELLSWEALVNERFLVPSGEPGSQVQQHITKRLAELGSGLNIAVHGVGREGILNLVGLRLGITLVAGTSLGVTYPGVVFKPVGDEADHIAFHAVWNGDSDNPALRKFVSALRKLISRLAKGKDG